MLKQIALFSAAAAFAMLSPNLIQAQDRSGALQGVVKDASGAPVAGAFVNRSPNWSKEASEMS
jgi:hypothetical protein